MSTSFFVAADWLAEHIDDPEIQIIDARMAPAGQEALRDMAAEYRAGHVPNALFFDIEALSGPHQSAAAYDAAGRSVCRRHARTGRLQR